MYFAFYMHACISAHQLHPNKIIIVRKISGVIISCYPIMAALLGACFVKCLCGGGHFTAKTKMLGVHNKQHSRRLLVAGISWTLSDPSKQTLQQNFSVVFHSRCINKIKYYITLSNISRKSFLDK